MKFFEYLSHRQKEFKDTVQDSKSNEEFLYRLQKHQEEHKWNSFICHCKNLLRWHIQKRTKL